MTSEVNWPVNLMSLPAPGSPPPQIDFRLIKPFLDGLKPVRPITVTEWAEKYRILSPVSSAKYGKYTVSYTPYLRAIMDALGVTQPYFKIVVAKGAQLGFSEAIYNFIGYIIDVAPASALIVMPTEQNMRKKSETSIGPMINDSPVLREKVGRARSRDSNNTKLSKSFPNGILNMVGANSPAALASLAAKFVLLDEPDRYPLDVGDEGRPDKLAGARARTFGDDAKIAYISTPTVKETSIIWSEFSKTDQNYYHVPCPHCQGYQKLEFSGLRWEAGKPKTVYYECIHCQGQIVDRHKKDMLANGQWIPDRPDLSNNEVIGYHLNSLYSPYAFGYSWAKVIKDWEDAQGDDGALKVFYNTVLGLPIELQSEVADWEAVFERANAAGLKEDKVPTSVSLITAGVDIQKDRIEMEIVGWGKGKSTWSLAYEVMSGSTSEEDVWNLLALQVERIFEREDGMLLPITMTCVDMGYNNQAVYDFCRRYDVTKVRPVRGRDDQKTIMTKPSTVDVKWDGEKVGSIQLWNIGVSVLKQEFYSLLKRKINPETGEIPKGYCSFPARDASYFKGLCSEQLHLDKDKKGRIKYSWAKRKGFPRNEPLDCRNYARAAAEMVGISRWKDEHYDDFALSTGKKKEIKPPPPHAKEQKKDGGYWKDTNESYW